MAKLNTYNPFGKKISELEASDLEVLKEVHEGWYVDYKEKTINARGYAKAISAMANTYGGWIFVGIKEASRDNNVAGSFPGLASDQIDLACQCIRQSVAEHLNPHPFFELKVVDAPAAEDSEKVICVYVPMASKAPIIHSDGRIYRRVNDSSESVAENNRESVEHLFQRAKELKKVYSDWFDKDPELSRAEDGVSFLRILALPDYWDEEQLRYDGSTEDFRKLLNLHTEGISFSVNYNNIYSKSGGFICRSVNAPDAQQITSTLIVNRDLLSEIWIPLPSFDLDGYSNYNDQSAALEKLVSHLLENGYENCTVLDLSQMFAAVDGFFTLQRKFQKHLGYLGETRVKFKLINVWRRIPLIAVSPTDLFWDEYGVPMILTNNVASPSGGAIESFQAINLHSNDGGGNDNFLLSTSFFTRLLIAVGLGVGSFEKFIELNNKAVMTSYQRAHKKDS